MRIVISINEKVHACLTEKGSAVWRRYLARVGEPDLCRLNQMLDVHTELWRLMAAFGPEMGGEYAMFVHGQVTVGEVKARI